ncbi:hypothetical protein CRENBAI_004301 [Crenichthys baileyi]|uniref:IF rod domain-containing protein n=1 Tax=Crenichthys baileyi TaxID=28760 RepID=A0AAV9RN81_9TELE
MGQLVAWHWLQCKSLSSVYVCTASSFSSQLEPQLLPVKMEQRDSFSNFGYQMTTETQVGMSRNNESYKNKPDKNKLVFEPSTDLSLAKIDLEKILSTQSKDSDLMKELNDRFANYIEKIRSLEKQNQTLKVEIEHLRYNMNNKEYFWSEEESSIFIENENMKIDNSMLKQKIKELQIRLANETKGRFEAEERITNLLESTTSEHLSLQQKYNKQTEMISNLKKQIQINKKHGGLSGLSLEYLHRRMSHREGGRETWRNPGQKECKQSPEVLVCAGGSTQMNEEYRREQITYTGNPSCIGDTTDGTKIDLNKIREEIDAIAKRNVTEIEEIYKSKEVEWKKTVSDIKTELNKVRREKEEYSHKIEQYKSEIKSLRIENTQIQALKVQIEEINKLHQDEISTFQKSIKTLEGNMTVKEEEIESRFNKYKDLQSAMLKMQTEITAYRRLLEAEESRINPTVLNESNADSEEDDKTSGNEIKLPSDDKTDSSAGDEDSGSETSSEENKD